MKKGKIITCNGWMFDEKEFPPNECIYVVALNIGEIEAKLTVEEISKYKYYIFVGDTHFFKEFNMPKFDVLFIRGWRKNVKAKVIDFDIVNFAVKNGMKLHDYNGQYSELLSTASTQKELKLHGSINSETPIDSITFHPEVLQNQPKHLNFE